MANIFFTHMVSPGGSASGALARANRSAGPIPGAGDGSVPWQWGADGVSHETQRGSREDQ